MELVGITPHTQEKTLVVMRHAEPDPVSGELTEKGGRDVVKTARWLKRILPDEPILFITSAHKRAKQTTDIVSCFLDAAEIRVESSVTCGQSVSGDIDNVLGAAFNSFNVVVVVTHIDEAQNICERKARDAKNASRFPLMDTACAVAFKGGAYAKYNPHF